MIKVAITGSIGAGKSTVVEAIEKNGFLVKMSDEIVDELYRTNLELKTYIASSYPQVIETGSIDKRKLSKIVFSDTTRIKRLEAVIFPLVQKEIESYFASCLDEFAFVEVPLLFESGFDKLFDEIIMIDAPLAVRIKRLVKYRMMDLEDALKRNSKQFSGEYKQKKSDYVIINDKDKEHLLADVFEVIKDIREKYAGER